MLLRTTNEACWRSGSRRTPGSPDSSREPGATRASARSSRREEVCLAAEQHDIGMAGWDLRPDTQPRHRPAALVHRNADRDSPGAVERRAAPAASPEPVRGAAGLDARGPALRDARSRQAGAGAGRRRLRNSSASSACFQQELVASLTADPATAARGRTGADRPQQPADLDLGLSVARPVPGLGAVHREEVPDGKRTRPTCICSPALSPATARCSRGRSPRRRSRSAARASASPGASTPTSSSTPHWHAPDGRRSS